MQLIQRALSQTTQDSLSPLPSSWQHNKKSSHSTSYGSFSKQLVAWSLWEISDESTRAILATSKLLSSPEY